MKLLPDEVRASLPKMGKTADSDDALAVVKFFTPDAGWTWFASEFDGDDIFYGVVDGHEVEFGTFSLSELESVRGRFGLPVERDLSFSPKRLAEIYYELRSRHSIR
jgi:Protein of unknown function (DUF2958)